LIWYVGFVAASDWPYRAALLLPEKLGLVAEIEAEDVTVIEPDVTQTVHLPKRGKYELFTFDGRAGQYGVTFQAEGGGGRVQVIAADTPVAGQANSATSTALPEGALQAGAPQSYLAYIVRANRGGSYLVTAAAQSTKASENQLVLVRSVANQNASIGIFGGLVQVGLVALIVWLIYRFINREKLKNRQATRQRKAETWGSVFSDPETTDQHGDQD
jgi:hypothetical protein